MPPTDTDPPDATNSASVAPGNAFHRDDPVAVEIGKRIRQARLRRGVSLVNAAEKLGLNGIVLGSHERADRALTVSKLYKIAAALGVTPQSLLPETSAPPLLTPEQQIRMLRVLADQIEQAAHALDTQDR